MSRVLPGRTSGRRMPVCKARPIRDLEERVFRAMIEPFDPAEAENEQGVTNGERGVENPESDTENPEEEAI